MDVVSDWDVIGEPVTMLLIACFRSQRFAYDQGSFDWLSPTFAEFTPEERAAAGVVAERGGDEDLPLNLGAVARAAVSPAGQRVPGRDAGLPAGASRAA